GLATAATAENRPSVEVIHPRRAPISLHLSTNATLAAFEEADLYAKVSGYLADVRVDIGVHVKAGQVLAVISDPELEKELAEAEAQLESKRKSLETARREIDHRKADLALQEITLKRQQTLAHDNWASLQARDEARGKAD